MSCKMHWSTQKRIVNFARRSPMSIEHWEQRTEVPVLENMKSVWKCHPSDSGMWKWFNTSDQMYILSNADDQMKFGY